MIVQDCTCQRTLVDVYPVMHHHALELVKGTPRPMPDALHLPEKAPRVVLGNGGSPSQTQKGVLWQSIWVSVDTHSVSCRKMQFFTEVSGVAQIDVSAT